MLKKAEQTPSGSPWQPARPVQLAIFLSHPIQHFVPWLRELDRRLEGGLVVHYASRQGLDVRRDPEFGESFAWDMDLLSGYRHKFWERPGQLRGPSHGFWGVRYPGLAAYLRRERPRATLVWGWLYAGYWQAAWTARLLGTPYFLRGESNLQNHGSTTKWWLKWQTVGRLCRGAAGCLAIGDRNIQLYKAYGVQEERTWLAPYFVDNDWFEAEAARLQSARTALRRRFGLPENGLVFLFMGKLIRKKHPDHALGAWKSLPESYRRRSSLLFVGNGEMMEELKKKAGAEARVAFAGFLNRRELPEAFAASDVLLLPSDRGETWGLVVNEAMASGLPVIVSDQVGCAPDLIREGETGFVFPFGDEPALTHRLCYLIDNPALVTKLGTAARTHINTASVTRAVNATLEALQSLPR